MGGGARTRRRAGHWAARAAGSHRNTNARDSGRREDGTKNRAAHGAVMITPGDTRDLARRQSEAVVPFHRSGPFKPVSCEPFTFPLLRCKQTIVVLSKAEHSGHISVNSEVSLETHRCWPPDVLCPMLVSLRGELPANLG